METLLDLDFPASPPPRTTLSSAMVALSQALQCAHFAAKEEGNDYVAAKLHEMNREMTGPMIAVLKATIKAQEEARK